MPNANREYLDLATGEVVQLTHILDEDGREHLDPTPIAPPVGYKKEASIFDHVRNLIRSERLAMEVELAGAETFEEADDFDVGDDFEPNTAYENDIDPSFSEIKREVERAKSPPQDGPSGHGVSQTPAPSPAPPPVAKPDDGATPSTPTPAS